MQLNLSTDLGMNGFYHWNWTRIFVNYIWEELFIVYKLFDLVEEFLLLAAKDWNHSKKNLMAWSQICLTILSEISQLADKRSFFSAVMALKKLLPKLFSCQLSKIFGPLVKKNCLILHSASEDGMVQTSIFNSR